MEKTKNLKIKNKESPKKNCFSNLLCTFAAKFRNGEVKNV